MPKPPEDLPAEEVSVGSVLGELREAEALIAEHARIRTDAERIAEQVAEEEAVVVDLDAQIAALTERRDAIVGSMLPRHRDQREDAQRTVAALPDDPDLAAFEAEIDKVEERNRAIRAAAERRAIAAEHQAKVNHADDLSLQIAQIDGDRRKAMAEAVLPVPGLDFGDGQVLYNGQPFAQASAAEQLRVSVAMAMALNPTVCVIRVENASLLDPENLAVIEAMAVERDFQVWLEVVGDGEVGIQIEDGTVIEATAVEVDA